LVSGTIVCLCSARWVLCCDGWTVTNRPSSSQSAAAESGCHRAAFRDSLHMDFTLSFHGDSGGTLHLPSPTHSPHVNRFGAAVNDIRRTLSRSPSKTTRFSLAGNSQSSSPGSPLSPFADPRLSGQKAVNPARMPPASPLGGTPVKKKVAIRRQHPSRAPSRVPRSPGIRRVLGDSSSQGNIVPFQ
jgi:mitosis inhibitor protein kinase SWE1